MTNIIGNDGNWDGPGTNAHSGNIRSWNATLRYTLSNVTGFTDTEVQRNRRGLPTLEGSATGNPVHSDSTLNAPTHSVSGGTGDPSQGSGAGGAAMTLTVATGCTWGFTGVISSIAFTVDKLGESVITYDFAMGDATDFTETWDIT